jgi:hypothetical protein
VRVLKYRSHFPVSPSPLGPPPAVSTDPGPSARSVAPPPAGDEAADEGPDPRPQTSKVAEVTSGLRRAIWKDVLAPEEAGQVLAAAPAWAKRLGRKRAYDAF